MVKIFDIEVSCFIIYTHKFKVNWYFSLVKISCRATQIDEGVWVFVGYHQESLDGPIISTGCLCYNSYNWIYGIGETV